MLGAVRTILGRDLLVERRTREAIPAMALLSVSSLVLLHFGLDRDRLDGELAAGVLWMALLVAASVGIGRLYAAEIDGRIDALRTAPIDPTALFLAKAGALFVFLFGVELIAIPAFLALFSPHLEPPAALPLGGVILAADLAVAVVGALVAALATAAGGRQTLAPLMALPLLVPVMIGAASASAPLLAEGSTGAGAGRWILVLLGYTAIFGLAACAVYEELIEQ